MIPRTLHPGLWKVVCLMDGPRLGEPGDTPELAVQYWKTHIETDERFNPDVEHSYVLILSTRRKIKGHALVSVGTIDTCLMHPREVYRTAIVANASAIVLAHNHPSGESSPSEADIKVSRDMMRAGQLLRIDCLDLIVIGQPSETNTRGYSSLRELGYFYS